MKTKTQITEVPLSNTLNPQLLPGRLTATHHSLITKDGSNAENNLPTRKKKGYIIIIAIVCEVCVIYLFLFYRAFENYGFSL